MQKFLGILFMTGKKNRNIFNALFLIIVFAVTMYSVFYNEDLSSIISYIRSADSRYWIIGVIFVLIFIECESVVIYYMLKGLGENVLFSHCCLYSFAGFFFSLITPSATGGQPAQLYFMKKDGLPLTVSTMVLVIVTITYKLVLVAIGILVFTFRPQGIMHYLSPVTGWCVLGMVLNIICIIIMFIFVFHPAFAGNTASFIINIAGRMSIIKNKQKYMDKLTLAMEKYKDSASYFASHKFVIWNVFCITTFQRIILFAVTYIVCISFNTADAGLFTITGLQAMISVAVDMLPLPGGMGITENLFKEIFTPLCGQGIVLPVMIASRGISYYTQLFISAVMSAVAYFKIVYRKGIQ